MQKILIRTPNHLGDCLMAQPSIRTLSESLQNCEIFLLTPTWASPIYGSIQNSAILPLSSDIMHGYKGIKSQIILLKNDLFDTAVLMTPSFSSAMILYLAGIKNRFGYNTDRRRIFLNHPVDSGMAKTIHRHQSYYKLMEYFAGHSLPFYPPRLITQSESHKAADKILHESGFNSDSSFIVIAPQAVAESRRWGTDNYASLARKLISDLGISVILIGTSSEFQAGDKITFGEKRIFNLCGKTNIADAAAIMSKAKLFIGNDSGLAHLAAAVDIPLVILSGADKPSETSPISDKKTVIIKNYLKCISCVKNDCRQKSEAFMRCMIDISVDEVLAASKNLLEIWR
jgi:heptosyltransferase-2